MNAANIYEKTSTKTEKKNSNDGITSYDDSNVTLLYIAFLDRMHHNPLIILK